MSQLSPESYLQPALTSVILCEKVYSQSCHAASHLVHNFPQLHIMHAIATVAVTPQRYLLQSLRLSGSDHEHPFLHTSQTLVLHFSFSKAKIVFISPCVSTIRTWSFAWSSSQNSWKTASRKFTRAVCLELNPVILSVQIKFYHCMSGLCKLSSWHSFEGSELLRSLTCFLNTHYLSKAFFNWQGPFIVSIQDWHGYPGDAWQF